MNLFLSSYQLGDHAELFVQMAGGPGARVAVITNAADAYPIEAQLDYARTRLDPLTWFDPWGLDPALIDLRRFFGRTDDLARVLRRHQAIWVPGGNSFLLRRAMRDSGFDTIIKTLLREGIAYGGYSAGACVMGESLAAIALMDDPGARAPGYLTDDPIVDGLDMVPFTIIPHVESDHPESEAAGRALAFAVEHDLSHVDLRDGEVVVRGGNAIEILRRRPT